MTTTSQHCTPTGLASALETLTVCGTTVHEAVSRTPSWLKPAQPTQMSASKKYEYSLVNKSSAHVSCFMIMSYVQLRALKFLSPPKSAIN